MSDARESLFDLGAMEVVLLVGGGLLTIGLIAFFAWLLLRSDRSPGGGT